MNVKTEHFILIILSILLIWALVNDYNMKRELMFVRYKNLELKISQEREVEKKLLKRVDSLHKFDNFVSLKIDSLKLYYEEDPILLPSDSFDFYLWARERYIAN